MFLIILQIPPKRTGKLTFFTAGYLNVQSSVCVLKTWRSLGGVLALFFVEKLSLFLDTRCCVYSVWNQTKERSIETRSFLDRTGRLKKKKKVLIL